MCITEPFQAVSCFGTKHLCSSHAWHLKTYLYNVSAPFVFFVLIFSSVFLVSHPDCKEQGRCWFPPVLFQTEALAAFGLSPLLRAEVKQPKIKHSFACFILSALRPAAPDCYGMEHTESLQKDLVLLQFLSMPCLWVVMPAGDAACRMCMAAIPSAGGDRGPDFQVVSLNMPSCKIPPFSLDVHNLSQVLISLLVWQHNANWCNKTRCRIKKKKIHIKMWSNKT